MLQSLHSGLFEYHAEFAQHNSLVHQSLDRVSLSSIVPGPLQYPTDLNYCTRPDMPVEGLRMLQLNQILSRHDSRCQS
ncbi:hypothetical protein VNO78_22825 [Psophocarpus tetragonolobus]|uniref:Uncharacterized protein n=1 Tax=Psophocarpus tetragonolobus TaxID=3891 RepID=A0AAN9S292_PSOTE